MSSIRHLAGICRYASCFLLLCLTLTGCGSGEPISSKTSKFEVADDEEATSPKPEKIAKPAAEEKTSAEPEQKETTEVRPNSVAGKTEPQKGALEAPDEPATPKREETGLYKVPNGPPAKQIEFIEQISSSKVGGNSAQSQKVDYEDKMNAIVASCGKILADAKATKEEKQFAIQRKFETLGALAGNLQSEDYAQKAVAFAAQLEANEKGTIERELGVTIGVRLLPQQFAIVEKPTDEEVKKLEEGYLSYLAEGPLPPMFEPGLQVAQILGSLGKREKAIVVIEAMLKAYSEAKDLPGLDKGIGELNRRLRLYQTDFSTKLTAALADEKAFAALDAAMDEVLKDEGSQPEWLKIIYGVGARFENEGKTDSATKVYARLAKLNETAVDADVGGQVKKLLANAEARRKLVGSVFDFTAETGDKSEFKLSSLIGKPVVVLFWTATDRGVSFNELGNIEQALVASKNAFEVVIVNIDDDPSVFEKFSRLQKVPFAIASVRCPNASEKGFQSDLEKQIGLDQLPFSLLINAEGKVHSTFAQGAKLASLIAELTSEKPAKPEATEEKPVTKPDTGEPGGTPPTEKKPEGEEKAASPKQEKPEASP